MADVATTKIFENDKIVVWEMNLAPGEATGVHTHTRSYMLYVIEGSTVDTLDTQGNSLGAVEADAGHTVYFELQGDQLVLGEKRFPAKHDAKNIGSTRYREVLVEFK